MEPRTPKARVKGVRAKKETEDCQEFKELRDRHPSLVTRENPA